MNIRPEFAYHRNTPTAVTKINEIREGFSGLLDLIESKGVTGRDLALAKTKLEEACTVSVRGVASLPENQE